MGGQSVALRSEKLVAEAGESSGTQRKRKLLPRNVTENTGRSGLVMGALESRTFGHHCRPRL
jgi:hypothetical protein